MWLGELGAFDPDEFPMAMQRALSPSEICEYDLCSIGISSTKRQSLVCDLQVDNESKVKIRDVRSLSLDYFWSKLAYHFDILRKKNELMWPKKLVNHK
jgi:hypothetical protein